MNGCIDWRECSVDAIVVVVVGTDSYSLDCGWKDDGAYPDSGCGVGSGVAAKRCSRTETLPEI